jgi:hypothetical protein
VPEPYLIHFNGGGLGAGRDVLPGVLFRVDHGGSTTYFGCTMTRDAAVGFRDLSGDDVEAILIAAGLDELERRLQAGLFPPEDNDLADVVFTSDQYEQLKTFADREKLCLWQERLVRGWICNATLAGRDSRTTAQLCAGCGIPDARLICRHLAHPEVEPVSVDQGLVGRRPQSAMCNVGNDPGIGADCRPGGLACWERQAEVGEALPAPPPDVARLASDEIDFLGLVYRDLYGSKVWPIPQARSISELFGDCDSPEDFARRLAALADLLAKLDPYTELSDEEQKANDGSRVGSLVALRRVMERDHPEAVSAVDRLRRITDARNQFPMHSRSEKLLAAFRDLGVEFPASDWRLAWLQVLTAFWTSLRAIRAALQTGPTEPEKPAGG